MSVIVLLLSDPRGLVAAALVGVVLALLRFRASSSAKPLPVEKANNKHRKYGHWTPEIFDTPKPAPYADWLITATEPEAYRAFRSKYTITMAIRLMDWNLWIELDNEWMKYHDLKVKRLASKGKEVCVTDPRAYAAAIELLDEFQQFLPQRYPTLFVRTANGLDNLVTGEKFDWRTTPLAEDPMAMAAKMVQDDLALMIEGEDGQYYLRGGAIMLAGFWRLRDKVNLPLSAIHTSGDVPKYNEKLKSGMEKFFVRLTCDKPVVRNNYFIQTDSDLAWSSLIGDEDNEVVGWFTSEPAQAIDQIYYRSERQSLRRLPKSGAIVFTIRTYFLPITRMCQEPHVPRRLLEGIELWTDDVQEYRGYTKFADVVLPYLEEKAREQEAQGITKETAPESYPY